MESAYSTEQGEQRMKIIMTFLGTIFLLGITSVETNAEILGDQDYQITFCQYYHNGDFYKVKMITRGGCPEINPPDDLDGRKHTITGDLPITDPRWNPALAALGGEQKVDDHDCVINIILDTP